MNSTEISTVTDNQGVGIVIIKYGNVMAISPDGMERFLSVESPIFAFDRIITESDGKVSIVINDDVHTQFDLGAMIDVMIDEDIFGGISPEEITEATAEVEQVQDAFFIEDIYLTAETELPAAGGGRTVTDFDPVTDEGDFFSTAVEKVSVIFLHCSSA